MIKAVFFDLYQTLARYEPPREEIHAGALKDLGINVEPEVFRRPIVAADEFIYQELAHSSLSKRSEKERLAVFVEYEKIVFRESGIEVDEKLIPVLLGKMQQVKSKLVPFDDVVPALTDLKSHGLILGLISNVDRDITSLLNELKLYSLLRVVVTSQEVGLTKPQAGIFQEALRRAGTQAAEAVYVGDQYQIDVIGANAVGMKGILLDRGGYFTGVTDSPRIRSLSQIVELLS